MKKIWTHSLIVIWALALALTLGATLGAHFMPHETPNISGIQKQKGFQVHHFISQYCNCSKNIFKHLIQRKKLSGVYEVVHLIGDDKDLIQKLIQAEFKIETLKEEEAVSKYNLEALPLLVIVQDGHQIHKGGYGKDQQHSYVYDDVSIIQRLQKKPTRGIASYPVFGCANGKTRKSKIDIWSLKYE
jgi:hypothetical protein